MIDIEFIYTSIVLWVIVQSIILTKSRVVWFLTFNYSDKLFPNQSCGEVVYAPLWVFDPRANGADKIQRWSLLVSENDLYFCKY